MISSMTKAILLLFVLGACTWGLGYAAETAVANESVNATLNATSINESEEIADMANDTLENETLLNGTLENETLLNETLGNGTSINETLLNQTAANETVTGSNPFANTKGKQPTRR